MFLVTPSLLAPVCRTLPVEQQKRTSLALAEAEDNASFDVLFARLSAYRTNVGFCGCPEEASDSRWQQRLH